MGKGLLKRKSRAAKCDRASAHLPSLPPVGSLSTVQPSSGPYEALFRDDTELLRILALASRNFFAGAPVMPI